MKKYGAVFFAALLAFGVVSCDDSGSKSEFELIGTWERTQTDITDTIYISTNQILITRDKTGLASGSVSFNMGEFDNANNRFIAVCVNVSDTDNVFQGFWTGGNLIYYFNYSVENDGMYYNKQENTYPGTWTIGPCVKQAAE